MLRKLRWQETPYPAQIKAKNPVHGTEDEEDSIGVEAVFMQCSNHQVRAAKAKDPMYNLLQSRISRRDRNNIPQWDTISATTAKDGDIWLTIAQHLRKVISVVDVVVEDIPEEDPQEDEEEEEETCSEAEAAIRQRMPP